MSSLLETIGKAIIEHAPEAFEAISKTLAAQGIDLGPMTPDSRADFAAVDAEIDREIAKTDPAPPRPSER
jgi:hypothetical protein